MGQRGPKPKRKEIIWSPDFAYGVGLMASDGCLSPDGRHLIFVSKDREQVEHVKSIFNVQAAIKITPSSNKNSLEVYNRLQWGDVILYDFFLEIEMSPNKSLILGVLKIPDMYFLDYARGSFDGDGCFYSYFDPRWKNSFMYYLTFTSASVQHLEWMRTNFSMQIGVTGHISSRQATGHNEFHQLRYAKREGFQILTRMYPNSFVMCLSRKRLKIQQALGIVGLSLPDQED